jgi:thioredoxin-dependent peroxiredoxin
MLQMVALGLVIALAGVKVGDKAPVFALPDQNGVKHALADYHGKWVALAFYPKDMTSGCTVQNKSFTEQMDKFTDSGIQLLAISVDTVDSHKQFCEKDDLHHTLLADATGDTATAYGVRTAAGYAQRTTFIIDPDGKVAAVFPNVDPKTSSQQILDYVWDADPTTKIVAPLATGLAAPEFSLKDTAGKTVRLSDVKASKGIVVAFVSPRCPVCRVYEDRLLKLVADFPGVSFLAVSSNGDELPEELAIYAERLKLPVLRDEGGKVAHDYRARMTPEVFLLTPDLKLVYQGSIDDQSEPSAVKRSDLRDALDAVVSGKPVPVKRTRPFGCRIKP